MKIADIGLPHNHETDSILSFNSGWFVLGAWNLHCRSHAGIL